MHRAAVRADQQVAPGQQRGDRGQRPAHGLDRARHRQPQLALQPDHPDAVAEEPPGQLAHRLQRPVFGGLGGAQMQGDHRAVGGQAVRGHPGAPRLDLRVGQRQAGHRVAERDAASGGKALDAVRLRVARRRAGQVVQHVIAAFEQLSSARAEAAVVGGQHAHAAQPPAQQPGIRLRQGEVDLRRRMPGSQGPDRGQQAKHVAQPAAVSMHQNLHGSSLAARGSSRRTPARSF